MNKLFFTAFPILFIVMFSPIFILKIENDYKIMSETKKTNISHQDLRSSFKKDKVSKEINFEEVELIAQLVMAEAGNQDLIGKRYVVDVVLNRVDSDEFPDTVEEVIFQEDQFSVIKNGAFDEAGWTVTEECYEAVKLEYGVRLNYDILYFSREPSKYASNHFKHQDHWFGW